jgi:hypothetical protein
VWQVCLGYRRVRREELMHVGVGMLHELDRSAFRGAYLVSITSYGEALGE